MSDGTEQADKAYLEAVRRLHFWQFGNSPNCFSNYIFSMFQRADNKNRPMLARAFPVEFAAYSEWQNAPSEDQFFKKYGLRPIRTFLDEKS